jgi:hypothetical protein
VSLGRRFAFHFPFLNTGGFPCFLSTHKPLSYPPFTSKPPPMLVFLAVAVATAQLRLEFVPLSKLSPPGSHYFSDGRVALF